MWAREGQHRHFCHFGSPPRNIYSGSRGPRSPVIEVEPYIVNPFISSMELRDWGLVGRNDEPGNKTSVKVHPDSPGPSDRPT